MPRPLPRTPPRNTLKELRQEVGFCCPVANCSSPYLTWHHFDPPWRYEQHHRVEGMIALCREHADKADHGAFTNEQIRSLKRVGRERAQQVRGRFDWMRYEILTVVAGNFFHRVDTVLEVNEVKSVWFDRDEQGYLLLNVRMPTLSKEPRARIEQNTWITNPGVEEVICPPHGRLIDIKYRNGDKFRVEFFSAETAGALSKRYPPQGFWTGMDFINYPITVAEIWATATGAPISLTPTSIEFASNTISGNLIAGKYLRAAIGLIVNDVDADQLFPMD